MHIEWHVGDIVRKLREQRRWTQQKLGEEAGLNKATIVAIEQGAERDVKTSTLQKIARALDTTLAHLYGAIPQETRRSAAVVETQPVDAAGSPFRDATARPASAGVKQHKGERR